MGAAIPASDLVELALECGLDDAAATLAFPVPVDAADLRQRLSAYPPELSYLARGLAKRLDPSLVLPGVRTVIAACMAYGGPHPGVAARPAGSGFVSRFAWCPDYHRPVGDAVARFAAGIEARTGTLTRAYVDTGPVLEKAYAAAAGLGFIGRHGLLVHPRFGSFVFLGVVLTDAEVMQDVERPAPSAGCGACTACLAACPTGALRTPFQLDVHRCLAHLTVTAKTPLPDGLPLAGNLYGCDICQDVCPFNRAAEHPARPALQTLQPSAFAFSPLPGLPFVPAEDVLAMDPAAFTARFGATPARRRGLPGVAAIAQRLIEEGA